MYVKFYIYFHDNIFQDSNWNFVFFLSLTIVICRCRNTQWILFLIQNQVKLLLFEYKTFRYFLSVSFMSSFCNFAFVYSYDPHFFLLIWKIKTIEKEIVYFYIICSIFTPFISTQGNVSHTDASPSSLYNYQIYFKLIA